MSDPVSTDVAAWTFQSARALIEGVADGIAILDGGGSIVLHNQAAAALFGVPAGDMVGERPEGPDWTFTGSDGRALEGDDHPLTMTRRGERPIIRHSIGICRSDAVHRWVHLSVRPLGVVPGLGDAMAIVLERAADPRSGRTLHSLAMDLEGGDHALVQLFGQGSVGMVHSNRDGVIVRANEAFARLVARPVPELLGTMVQDLVAPEDLERNRLNMRRLLRGGADHNDAELRLVRGDGTTTVTQIGTTAIRGADGRCESFINQVVDVSRLRRAEDFMSRRALFDPLTQLINRTLLIDLMSDQLRIRHQSLAVIALNLDRFKAVNDSLGQSTGDAVLIEVAGRLREHLQPGDAAARISGDDFVMLCGNVNSRAQADALTQRVLDAVAEPIDIEGLRIQLTASAGVSLIDPASGLSADQVMFQATAALAHAKARGRARWKVFDQEMHVASIDRLRIESSLRAALAEDGLRVAYQPLLDLRSHTTVGAEALVRWHDPVLGTITPTEFLPVAEEAGLIGAVGAFVLGNALTQVAHWRQVTGQPLHVSVNLSPNELNRPGITARMAEALEQAGLPPGALRLEITEDVLVDADAQVRGNLRDLRELGVAVGIDDFGTGYASMSYLKHLPVDFVKIDRSFVAGVGTSREDRAIVRATLDLAMALNLTTVAEGIETAQQLEVLTELGCDVAQGYLIGRAEPAAEMLGRLAVK